jgi:hypothetical protein
MAPTPPITIDLPATRRRIIRLNRYVEKHLLQHNRFICPSCSACRGSKRPSDEFRTGTMGHVGKRFDLTMGGKPLRIVVVGQEAKDSKVSLDQRYQQVRNGSGRDRRYYADGEHPSRNPHMRGTTSALRLVFGTGLGSDYEGEFVHPVGGRPFHIFDGFALLNRPLCYAGPEKGVQARPTPTMFDNCSTHLDATLDILEPTILILQGKKVSAATDKILTKGRDHGDHLYEGFHGERRILVCHFSHPSAHGDQRWGDSLHAPYLKTVKQTLHQAVRRL